MYFACGWPKYVINPINSVDPTGCEDQTVWCGSNHNAMLLAIVTRHSVMIWATDQNRGMVAQARRDIDSIIHDGSYQSGCWHPESHYLAVTTTGGYVHIYEIDADALMCHPVLSRGEDSVTGERDKGKNRPVNPVDLAMPTRLSYLEPSACMQSVPSGCIDADDTGIILGRPDGKLVIAPWSLGVMVGKRIPAEGTVRTLRLDPSFLSHVRAQYESRHASFSTASGSDDQSQCGHSRVPSMDSLQTSPKTSPPLHLPSLATFSSTTAPLVDSLGVDELLLRSPSTASAASYAPCGAVVAVTMSVKLQVCGVIFHDGSAVLFNVQSSSPHIHHVVVSNSTGSAPPSEHMSGHSGYDREFHGSDAMSNSGMTTPRTTDDESVLCNCDADLILLGVLRVAGSVSLQINERFRLAAVGCDDGTIGIYHVTSWGGGCPLTRTFSLAPWGFSAADTGAVVAMEWTVDGAALACGWANRGVAVWSRSGCRLMCTLPQVRAGVTPSAAYSTNILEMIGGSATSGRGFSSSLDLEADAEAADGDDSSTNAYSLFREGVVSISWVAHGFCLVVIPRRASSEDEHTRPRSVQAKRVPLFVEFSFLKQADGCSKRERTRLVLHGPGEVFVPVNTQCNPMRPEEIRWHQIRLPSAYLAENWPIRHLAASDHRLSVGLLAVAGRRGLVVYSHKQRRWRMFGDVKHEKAVRSLGLVWLGNLLIVANEAGEPSKCSYELLVFPSSHLDMSSSLLHRERVPGEPVLMDIRPDGYLLVLLRTGVLYLYQVAVAGPREHHGLPKVAMQLLRKSTLHESSFQPLLNIRLPPLEFRKACRPPPREPARRSVNSNASGDAPLPEGEDQHPTHCFLLRSSGTLVLLDMEHHLSTAVASGVEQLWYSPDSCSPFEDEEFRPLWWAYGTHGLQVCFRSVPSALSLAYSVRPGRTDTSARTEPVGLPSYRPETTTDVWVSFDVEVYPIGLVAEHAVIIGVTQGLTPGMRGLAPSSLTDSAVGQASLGSGSVSRGVSLPCAKAGAWSGSPYGLPPVHALPRFEPRIKSQSIAHSFLRHLLRYGHHQQAFRVSHLLSRSPSFLNSLEWLLHEALEDGASGGSSGSAALSAAQPHHHHHAHLAHGPVDAVVSPVPPLPAADGPNPELFPRVISLIRHFAEFEDVVVRCARKTDSRYWPVLFSLAGEATTLMDACFNKGNLNTAACYLVILQSMWGQWASVPQALRLLKATLSSDQLCLASDLVMFLSRSIPEDLKPSLADVLSPPTHLENQLPSAAESVSAALAMGMRVGDLDSAAVSVMSGSSYCANVGGYGGTSKSVTPSQSEPQSPRSPRGPSTRVAQTPVSPRGSRPMSPTSPRLRATGPADSPFSALFESNKTPTLTAPSPGGNTGTPVIGSAGLNNTPGGASAASGKAGGMTSAQGKPARMHRRKPSFSRDLPQPDLGRTKHSRQVREVLYMYAVRLFQSHRLDRLGIFCEAMDLDFSVVIKNAAAAAAYVTTTDIGPIDVTTTTLMSHALRTLAYAFECPVSSAPLECPPPLEMNRRGSAAAGVGVGSDTLSSASRPVRVPSDAQEDLLDASGMSSRGVDPTSVANSLPPSSSHTSLEHIPADNISPSDAGPSDPKMGSLLDGTAQPGAPFEIEGSSTSPVRSSGNHVLITEPRGSGIVSSNGPPGPEGAAISRSDVGERARVSLPGVGTPGRPPVATSSASGSVTSATGLASVNEATTTGGSLGSSSGGGPNTDAQSDHAAGNTGNLDRRASEGTFRDASMPPKMLLLTSQDDSQRRSMSLAELQASTNLHFEEQPPCSPSNGKQLQYLLDIMVDAGLDGWVLVISTLLCEVSVLLPTLWRRPQLWNPFREALCSIPHLRQDLRLVLQRLDGLHGFN
eukprot:Rmarinus@m.14482